MGIDHKFIDVNLATTIGWDADRVKAVAQEANNKLAELGYDVQNFLVDLGDSAESIVSADLVWMGYVDLNLGGFDMCQDSD